MTVLQEHEYTYRLPKWSIGVFLVLLFGTPVCLSIGLAIMRRSWLYGIAGTGSIAVAACYAVWFWSKIRVILDSQRIRWPLKRKELRWDDIESSTLVRRLGFTYVRVVKKDGGVIRIDLNLPGVSEFRRRLLRRLELD